MHWLREFAWKHELPVVPVTLDIATCTGSEQCMTVYLLCMQYPKHIWSSLLKAYISILLFTHCDNCHALKFLTLVKGACALSYIHCTYLSTYASTVPFLCEALVWDWESD